MVISCSHSLCLNSISGSSATIFAYLGEFHSSQNRSKVLMAASFIYGLACNYLPALGFLILNRTFHFHIPLLDIEFKPWRFYLLLCGLPSLVSAIILLIFIPESPKFTFSKVSVSIWRHIEPHADRKMFLSLLRNVKYGNFVIIFFRLDERENFQVIDTQ